jgi:hypothetical protein
MNRGTGLLIAVLSIGASMADAIPQTGDIAMRDHTHDFDFLNGKRRLHDWHLTDRLAGGHDWVEFAGTSELWMTMDGHGTVDDNYIGLRDGSYRAMGVRGYDPKTQTWAIWRLDARNPHHLEPPVFGNFIDGVGTFEDDDTFRSKPMKVRFTLSRITPSSALGAGVFTG